MKNWYLVIFACAVLCSEIQGQRISRHAVIITELFPDPSGQSVFPNAEFIELKNNSADTINMKGWKISDGSAAALISNDLLLAPEAFMIVCPNNAATAYSAFGKTVGVANFPSLNNDKDLITIHSADNHLIHAVSYQQSFYHSSIKADGGWSLEMIDISSPCTGEQNWKACVDKAQATPGRKNSVASANADLAGPHFLRSYANPDSSFTLVFDETLDSTSAANPDSYQFNNPQFSVKLARAVPPLFQKVIITLTKIPDSITQHVLSVKSVRDCAGNAIRPGESVSIGLPAKAKAHDLVINEILFNPPGDGADYIELYNQSDHIIDLQTIALANPKSGGGYSNVVKASSEPYHLFPKQLIVFTSKKDWVISHYNPPDAERIMSLSSLPSMPDDKGEIVILDESDNMIDMLAYSEKWHFELIVDREGVALEKIDAASLTQDGNHWVSASSVKNYGTPGYKNSQFRPPEINGGAVGVGPKTFSPDNDGLDDFLLIDFKMTEPNCAGSVTIYNLNGNVVCYLVKSALLGMKGSFRWDGLNEKKEQLPAGIYIVTTEFYSTSGKVMRTKNAVVLARKFR